MHATTSYTVCNKLDSNHAGCLFRLLSNSLYLYACQWVVVKILKNFPGHQENEAIVFICCLGVKSIGNCGNAIPQIIKGSSCLPCVFRRLCPLLVRVVGCLAPHPCTYEPEYHEVATTESAAAAASYYQNTDRKVQIQHSWLQGFNGCLLIIFCKVKSGKRWLYYYYMCWVSM